MSDTEAQRISFQHGAVAGYGVDNASVAGGQFSADIENGGWLTMATSVDGGALATGRVTNVYPINAALYTHLTFRMFSASHTNGGVFYFGGDNCGPSCLGVTPIDVPAGWHTYDVVLGSPNIAQQAWTGNITGVRLDPSSGPGVIHQSLDWMRLNAPGPNVTATVPAAADSVWLDPTACPAGNAPVGGPSAGAEVIASNLSRNQQVTVPTGTRPAGTYCLYSQTGSTFSASTPLTIDARPEPQILSPTLAGGDDWATTVRGDAWDFNQASDISQTFNAAVTVAGGKANGQNTGPNNGDPAVFLTTPTPIDATRFHRLTFQVHYDGPFSLGPEWGGGMVARFIWNLAQPTPAAANQVSNDIIVYPGDNTISVDLRTNPPAAINDNDVTDRLGWGGPQSGSVLGVRLDPNEDPGPRTWSISDVRLTANDQGRPDFNIQYQDNAYKAGTTADLYVDTNGSGSGGTKIVSGLAVAAGVNTFNWRGSDVNGNPLGANTFHVYAVLHDPAGATGQSRDSSNLDMPVQPSALAGSLDVVNRQPDGVHVGGWALDPRPGAGNPTVHLSVDGGADTTVATNVPRPDINAAFPSVPGNHGFTKTLVLGGGTHNVCSFVTGANTPNLALGCRSVTVASDPFGSLDVASRAPGGLRMSGWTIDPDTSDPVTVALYVDAAGATAIANTSRTDVGSSFPGYGNGHGFDAVVAAAAGTHQVCAYAYNVSGTGGATVLLGCKIVTISGQPVGSFDAVRRAPGGVHVSGWAIDPDTGGPDTVAIYVDASGTPIYANSSRPDIANAFPGYGPDHGFDADIPAGAGPHTICAYAFNSAGAGSTAALGCKTFTANSDPVGSFDVASSIAGGIHVEGWALDPDTAAPIPVHIYIDSSGTALTANGPRPDIGGAFPGYGNNHGFSASLGAAPGRHNVCAYAINAAGAGTTTVLGCRSVTV